MKPKLALTLALESATGLMAAAAYDLVALDTYGPQANLNLQEIV